MSKRYDPEIHHRRSIRLSGYDYSQAGAYFVTLCEVTRQCLFGDIKDGEMRPNSYGEVILACWNEIPDHFPGVELDAFVLMPNHVHGVLVLPGDALSAEHPTHPVGARHASPSLGHASPSLGHPAPVSPPTLGTIIGSFKSAATRHINLLRDTPSEPVWLRNYFERVIRNEAELNKIREYITYNPANWDTDKINPVNSL